MHPQVAVVLTCCARHPGDSLVLMGEKDPGQLHPSKGPTAPVVHPLLPQRLLSSQAHRLLHAHMPGCWLHKAETTGPGLWARHPRALQEWGDGLWSGGVRKSPSGVAGRPSRTQLGGEERKGHFRCRTGQTR